MKKILFIATGGTIASAKTENGLTPAITSEELLDAVPEIRTMCTVDTVQPYSLDSTNMCWRQWVHLAQIIRDGYAQYDGFVITHGTDTMAYAAATMSYLVQRNLKPIVFTGAQKSIEEPDGDARRNLYEAFAYATDDRACGTHVVFNSHVIAGTRARKTHSKSFDAFSSINYPNIAAVRDGRILRYIEPEHLPEPKFYGGLDTRVGLLKLIPGTEPELLEFMLRRCRALVIESFGVGGLPERGGMHALVKSAALEGKAIVMTTQVQNEGSDLAVYGTGSALARSPGIMEAYDMTTEAADLLSEAPRPAGL